MPRSSTCSATQTNQLPALHAARPLPSRGRFALALPATGESQEQALRALSLRLLKRAPAARTAKSNAGFAAATRSFVELGSLLCGLVGSDGYRALMTRALRLAAAEFPLLSVVRPGVSSPGRLVGWTRYARHAPVTEVHDAVTATLAELLHLLDQFLGPDLTQRIICEVWPWLSDSRQGRTQPRRLTG